MGFSCQIVFVSHVNGLTVQLILYLLFYRLNYVIKDLTAIILLVLCLVLVSYRDSNRPILKKIGHLHESSDDLIVYGEVFQVDS